MSNLFLAMLASRPGRLLRRQHRATARSAGMTRRKLVGIRNLNPAFLAVAVCGFVAPGGMAQDRPARDRARQLIENLHAEKVDVRRDAATQIRPSDRNVQREALPALIERLEKEKDGQVRLAVLDSLAVLGPDAASAVPALVRTLETDLGGRGSEASHQDYRSALALASIGAPAVDGLRSLLKAKKDSVRAEAAMALGRIGPDGAKAAPDLIVLLADKSERCRREASRSLGRIGTAAIAPLIAAAAHKDAIVRAGAVEGIGFLSVPDDQSRRAATESAHDTDPAVRAAAVKSLARLAVPDDVLLPILRENVGHEDEQVRLAVVNLLVERRALLARLAPELEALLTAKNDGVSRHAAFLLGTSGLDRAPRLPYALHESSRIDQIALALAQIGRPAVVLLRRSLQAPEPRVRRGAALALGQIRPLASGTVPALTAGLNDPDPLAKAAFLTAIEGHPGPRAGESVPAAACHVARQLRDSNPGDSNPDQSPHDDRLLGDLMALLDDDDVRTRAAERSRSSVPWPAGPKSIDGHHRQVGQREPGDSVGGRGNDWKPRPGGRRGGTGALLVARRSGAEDPDNRAVQALGSIGKSAQPALARMATPGGRTGRDPRRRVGVGKHGA